MQPNERASLLEVPPVIAQPPPIPSCQPRKKGVSGKWILIALSGCLLLGLGILVILATGGNSIDLAQREEVQVLNTLCGLNVAENPTDVQKLCTPEGFGLAQVLTDGRGMFGPATFRVTGIKSNPRLSDIQMARDTAEGKSIISVRMVDQDGWKFHDVYIHVVNGEKANMWASYEIEHPVSSALERVDWIEVLRTADEIADVLGKFKALSDDKSE